MNNSTIGENEKKLSDIIALIYDSSHQPELWPKLLDELDALIGQQHIGDNTDSSALTPKNNTYVQLLKPHFQRALELNKAIYSLKTERNALSDILDRLPIGVILIDAEQTPRAMNAHAQAFIETGKCLSVYQGQLVANTKSETKALHAHIHEAACSLNEDETTLSKNLQLSNENGGVCSLHIVPSATTAIQTDTMLAAVFIASNDIRQPITTETLSNAFGLTQAEGRLVQTMLNGSNSLTEAAEELGVSKHTVRSQIKNILEKTGTHSQTELIKKVLTSPTALVGQKQSVQAISDLMALEANNKGDVTPFDPFNVIKLFSNRQLEYREYGDPEGIPVIFFHSCIHSRLTLHPQSTFVEDNNIRIIAPERPGFGHSTLLDKSNESEAYAKDIKQLLEHLNIEKCYIVCDISGAWAGFTCAHFLKEQVIRLAVMSPYPEPKFDFPKQAIAAERIMLKTYQTMPMIFHMHIGKIILRSLIKKPEEYFMRIFDDLCKSDQDIVKTPEHQAIVGESFREAYPNHVKGYVDDFMQRAFPWDFDINDCQVETHIWHGTANTIIPYDTAKKMADSLPNAKLFPVPQGGHFVMMSHWDKVLQTLIEDTAN